MVIRLLVGLLKGLVIGGAIGAGIQYGLHWSVPSAGLLGFLFAMGAAGSTGVFAGRPPWREGAWIEALLKGMVGVGAGALVYWLASTYAALEIPFPDMEGSTAWTGIPVLFLPLIAGVYGALVELDNTGDESKGGASKSKGPKTRVVIDDDISGVEATEHAEASLTKGGRRKARD